MEIALRSGDSEKARLEKNLPVTIVLDNLRSAYNVGNVFRAAEATRAAGIVTCGYTATPPHVKLQKTARGCDELVPCEHFDTTAEAITTLRGRGLKIYAVETVENSQMYWDAPMELPCAFVLGNEALGISQDTLALCDGFISLPALGRKNSINVGNCAAVILFECARRFLYSDEQHR